MLTKWLVPEIAYLKGHPLQSELHVEAQRSFGFTFVRGLLLGAAMFVPSICVVAMLQEFGVRRRSEMSSFLFVLVLLCALSKGAVMLVNRRSARIKIRELMRGYGIPICHGCGYNLTGNVSGVCSECGLKTTDLDDWAY